MEIEIAAVLTIAPKLELLEKLLDRRIARAALDTTSPALPLLERVYRLGEYKRLAANLAVMEHRIRCALGDGETDALAASALRRTGVAGDRRHVRSGIKKAWKVLSDLGVADLEAYKTLPLFGAECRRLGKLAKKRARPAKNMPLNRLYGVAACACSPDDRTVRA